MFFVKVFIVINIICNFTVLSFIASPVDSSLARNKIMASNSNQSETKNGFVSSEDKVKELRRIIADKTIAVMPCAYDGVNYYI